MENSRIIAIAFVFYPRKVEYIKDGWDYDTIYSQSVELALLLGDRYEFSTSEIAVLQMFFANRISKYLKDNTEAPGLYVHQELSQELVNILGPQYTVATSDDKIRFYLRCTYFINDGEIHAIIHINNKDIIKLDKSEKLAELPRFNSIIDVSLADLDSCFYEYDQSLINSYIYIVVNNKGLYGLYTESLQCIIPCKFSKISICRRRLYADSHLIKKITYDKDLLDLYIQYDWVDSNNNLTLLWLKDKVGCITPEGIIIPCEYDSIELLTHNYTKNVIPDDIIESDEDKTEEADIDIDKYYILVSKSNKYGVYSTNCQRIIIPTICDSIERTDRWFNGIITTFIVTQNGNKGVINELGDVLVPCIYKYIFLSLGCSNCIIAYISDDECILYRNGKQISRKYQNIRDFHKGIAMVNMGGHYVQSTTNNHQTFKGGKWGLINEYGKVILLCNKYTSMCYIQKENKYLVGQKVNGGTNKYYLLNEQGTMVYDYSSFEEVKLDGDILIVKKDGRYGLSSYWGNLITECQYDEINNFSAGYARVRIDSKYGYIDQKGIIKSPLTSKYLPQYYQEILEKELQALFDDDRLAAYEEYRENQRDMEESAFYALTDGQYGEYNNGVDWDSLMDSLGY